MCHSAGAKKDAGGDQLAPPAPMLTAVSPTSPANNNNPTVTGTAEAGSTVTIYGDSACTMMLASGTAAELASPGITFAVTDDTTYAFAAVARDAAGNASGCSPPLAFVEDSMAPAAPAIVDTVPPTPSRSVVPTVRGTAEAGTTITLYPNANCTGTMLGTGTTDGSGMFAVVGTVQPAAVTNIAAIAKDAAGNASGCSNMLAYEQDASAVSTPVLSATVPASPSNTVMNPMITGTAEAGTTVRLFTDPTCGGTPVATGVATSLGAYSITVNVSANTTTTYYAQALDTSVNKYSACTATGITYQHDATSPAPPVVMATTPGSPSNSQMPTVSGTAEAGSLVKIYNDNACATTALAMGTTASNGTFSMPVSTTASTTFYGKATDPAGNVSACSASGLAYTYDATPPAKPTAATNPVSPSNSNNTPIIQGTAEPNSLVSVYLSSDCSGTAVASGSSSTTSYLIQVTVPSNAMTPITVDASDAAGNKSMCSTAITYVHDDVAPAAPAFTGSNPTSPGNNNSPMVMGTAEMGASVQLYTNSGCTTPIGSAAVATSGTFSIPISVTDNTATTVYAKATDSVGNASGCSIQSLTFTEDSAAPSAPVMTALAPSSTNTTPTLTGSAEAGATVNLYATANCSGTAVVTTTATGGSFSAMTTVTANSSTPFSAKAVDAAGNTSGCSNSINYIHDNVVPNAPTGLASNPVSPNGSTSPQITGSAEANSTVRLYTNFNCSSAIVGTLAATAGGTFSIGVNVSSGSTTTFYANTTDAANNTSSCSSAGVTYTQDNQPPATPSNLATNPPSPASNASPMVTGNAEAGSTVKLYTAAGCSGAVAFSGTANGGGTFSIATTVTMNASTTFYATATDSGGNASGCTPTGLTYLHDSTVPNTPVISATTPVSPANNNGPSVNGTAEAGSTVKLWTSSDCTTGMIGSPAVATGGAFSIGLSVSDNTTTTMYANATDAANNVSVCSAAFTYIEDSQAPSTPTALGTNPPSPKNDNNPALTGTSEQGATVQVYTVAGCGSGLTGTAVAGVGGAFSVPLSVSDNTTTAFYVKAVDAAGNTSSCSSAVNYVEDSLAPSAPVISATSPTSPSSNNTPQVSGTAEAGSTVKIYTASNCLSGQVGSGLATGGNFAITTSSLTSNVTTTLYATSTDPAGNASACSSGFNYVEDSTAPSVPTGLGTNPSSPANDNSPSLIGMTEAGASVRAYSDTGCTTQVGATATADGTGAFAIPVTVLDNSTTTYYVRSTDLALNTSACDTVNGKITYVEDSSALETPVITGSSPTSPTNTSPAGLSPSISGTSITGYTITLYTTSNCTGTAAGTGTASSNAFSISVSVSANSSTTYYAKATQSTFSSGCSVGFTYVHDATAPSAPTTLSVTPAGPANNNLPTVTGNAETGSTVRLYTNSGCTLPSATGIGNGVASGGAFSIPATVSGDATTTIYAKATDAAGNASACSSSFATYVEDSTAPTAPTVSSTSPPSPANGANTSPTVNGSAETGSTVKIYSTASCTGAPAATGTATSGAFNIAVSVSANTTTTFKATATDAAGNTSACSSTSVTYVHDSVVPATPTLAIVPAGPANNNSPHAQGSAESGSTVTIHTANTCSAGSQVASGTATGGTPNYDITLSVTDNTTTTFYAKSTDAAGNASACTAGASFTEDSAAPTTPVFTGTTPASPSKTSTTPTINGTAELGSTVSLFTNSSCTSGTAIASGTATGLPGGSGTFAIGVTVTANTSTTFYAQAADSSGNKSGCTSTGLVYTHDTVAPNTPTLSGTTPASPANNNSPTVNGTAETGATINVYTSSGCATSSIASGTAVSGSFAVTVSVTDNTTTTFYVKATDPAGNSSGCTATGVTYVEDSTPPGLPILVSSSPGSPSNVNNPDVIGTLTGTNDQSGSTVKIYATSDCTGTVLGSSTSTFNAATNTNDFTVKLSPGVTANTTTTFYATATDSANNASACSSTSITYVEDSTAPATPSNLGTTPASPANNNNPKVGGTAETGSTVKVYTTSGCTGTFVSGTAASNSFLIQAAAVSDNTTTTYYVTATDAAGNVSACSAGVQYKEDSVANAPVLTSTSPASPNGTSTTPTIFGTGEPNATFKLFTNNACTMAATTSGSIDGSGNFSVSVTVSANSSNTYYANITDVAGNSSGCSAGLTYVHDTTSPTVAAPTSAVATSTTQILVSWASGSDNLTTNANLRYDVCWRTSPVLGTCTGSFTTAGGATSYTIGSLSASTRYWVWIRAVDQVGNTSAYMGPASDRTWGTGTNVQVASGYTHTCSLVADGTVRCWGDNADGQLGNSSNTGSLTPVTVTGLDDVIQIAAGGAGQTGHGHSCAVKANGTVWCWGYNNYGELGDSSNTSSNEPVQVTGIANATKVAAGHAHSCALLSTGGIKCWGLGVSGQLGNSASSNSNSPVPVTSISTAIDIDVGSSHSCAVLADGTARCWGSGGNGRLGNGGTTTSNVPVTVSLSSSDRAKAIELGNYHSCALLTSGQVRCWGGNASGQLGNNSTTESSTPVTVVSSSGSGTLTGVATLSAGGDYETTVTNLHGTTCSGSYTGIVYCWGKNNAGQIGDSTSGTDRLYPTQVASGSYSTQISVGQEHTCYRQSLGLIRCFGNGGNGRLGHNSTSGSTSQVLVQNLAAPERAIVVRSSNGSGNYGDGFHSCALLSNGEVKCWGRNQYGQLGVGTTGGSTPYSLTSVKINSSTTLIARAIAVGGSHACAVQYNGYVLCWGYNYYGQLGDATNVDKNYATGTAFSPGAANTVIDVSAGNNHTCAQEVDGDVKCWGHNGFGQLANGGTTDTNAPPASGTFTLTRSMVASTFGTCAAINDGTMKCSGYDYYGGCGAGTATTVSPYSRVSPTTVSGASNVIGIGSNRWGNCFVLGGGTAKCMGHGGNGQMGNGTTTATNATPVSVSGTDYTGLSGGEFHQCARKTGAIRCWGSNGSGELGLGTTGTAQSSPTTLTSIAQVKDIGLGGTHSCALIGDGTVECWGLGTDGAVGDNLTTSHAVSTPSPVFYFP